MTGTGRVDDPWVLRTPPGTSDYTMYRDDSATPPQLVGRAGMYLPPLLEELGLAELEHQPRNNRMRAR